MDTEGCYAFGAFVTWVLAFLAGMVYAVSAWGWFLGVGVGWLPAAVVALVVAVLWPVLLFGIVALVLWVFV